MTNELLKLYARARREKPFMRVGFDAADSLKAARTILEFKRAEADGLVRMRAEPEQESYFDVYGDEELRHAERNGHSIPHDQARKELCELLDRYGVWWTVAEWFDGEEWQQAESCGMHAGYKDPLDPFENCYVVQEMQSALDALADHRAEIRETALAANWP